MSRVLDPSAIERAIIQGARAGKLREYIRKHGEAGLGGLVRLADRHSRLSTTSLEEWVGVRSSGEGEAS